MGAGYISMDRKWKNTKKEAVQDALQLLQDDPDLPVVLIARYSGLFKAIPFPYDDWADYMTRARTVTRADLAAVISE